MNVSDPVVCACHDLVELGLSVTERTAVNDGGVPGRWRESVDVKAPIWPPNQGSTSVAQSSPVPLCCEGVGQRLIELLLERGRIGEAREVAHELGKIVGLVARQVVANLEVRGGIGRCVLGDERRRGGTRAEHRDRPPIDSATTSDRGDRGDQPAQSSAAAVGGGRAYGVDAAGALTTRRSCAA